MGFDGATGDDGLEEGCVIDPCRAITCTDRVENGTEAGVNRGGACDAARPG